tara:strand:- start:792 stop:1025 length:234 start_codon:yes stop_codon:yes gene_type:complete
MNKTQRIQIINRFPEIVSLTEKINKMGIDKEYWRDEIFFLIFANTCRSDAEALGIITRIQYLFNKKFDEVEKRKHFE